MLCSYCHQLYCITSLILFIFPCYKKKNPIKIDLKGNVCILGGHRGGAWERLESTIPAFKHAKESNMNILEMDIQFTKDKKIVVHHDDTLERLTGQKEKVEQLNYDQIHKCKEVVCHASQIEHFL